MIELCSSFVSLNIGHSSFENGQGKIGHSSYELLLGHNATPSGLQGQSLNQAKETQSVYLGLLQRQLRVNYVF